MCFACHFLFEHCNVSVSILQIRVNHLLQKISEQRIKPAVNPKSTTSHCLSSLNCLFNKKEDIFWTPKTLLPQLWALENLDVPSHKKCPPSTHSTQLSKGCYSIWMESHEVSNLDQFQHPIFTVQGTAATISWGWRAALTIRLHNALEMPKMSWPSHLDRELSRIEPLCPVW